MFSEELGLERRYEVGWVQAGSRWLLLKNDLLSLHSMGPMCDDSTSPSQM